MTDLSKLKVGLKGTASIKVGEDKTAPRIGSGRVRVLATPVMINMMEAAALDAVESLLPPGHQSLCTHLDVGHYAATPVGMTLRATAEVTKNVPRAPAAAATTPRTWVAPPISRSMRRLTICTSPMAT